MPRWMRVPPNRLVVVSVRFADILGTPGNFHPINSCPCRAYQSISRPQTAAVRGRLMASIRCRMNIMLDEKRFKELVDERNVAVVHFSHCATMNHRVEFPEDLNHAIDHFANETRSCCALFPGHEMSLPGSVGLIFSPTLAQVLSVCSSDSGSTDFGGEEGSLGESPTEEAILGSLNVRSGDYNEWRIRGAEPIGIFVANPAMIEVRKAVTYSLGDNKFSDFECKNIQLSDVFTAFPGKPVFTMGTNGIEKLGR